MEKEKMKVSGLTVIQQLYETARDVLDSGAESSTFAALTKAVRAIERAARFAAKLEAVYDASISSCPSEDIDQTTDFTYHNGVNGYFVMAWLFVYEEEVRTETTCAVCGETVWLHPGLRPRHEEQDLDDEHNAEPTGQPAQSTEE